MAQPLDDSLSDIVRRLREDLEATEGRLRAVVANAPIVLFSIDQAGVFTLSEGKSLERLGLRPGEVVGRSVYDLYRDNPEIIASVQRALAGDTFTSVAEVAGLVYETHYAPLRDDRGITGVIGVATDVTEATRRAQSLAETGRMLRVLVEASPVPITALDVEGRVQLWNPAAERTFGWSAQEVLGLPYPLVPEGREEEFRQLLQEVVGNGATLEGVELRRRRKDGSSIDIALSAAPLLGDGDTVVGAMAVLVDISDAKRSEQALRESESKYRSIFDNVQDVFYQTEPGGAIVEVSPSVRQFGYSREQLIGSSVLDIYPDAEERAAFVKAVSARGEVADYEIKLKRGDGGTMVASVSAHVRRDASGDGAGPDRQPHHVHRDRHDGRGNGDRPQRRQRAERHRKHSGRYAAPRGGTRRLP